MRRGECKPQEKRQKKKEQNMAKNDSTDNTEWLT